LHGSDVVTALVQQLTAWLVQHTYLVVFVCTLVDATAIPFPGRLVLAAAGAFAAAGDTNPWLVIVIGTAGIVITDHVWYFAGTMVSGDRLLRLYCRLTFSTPDCVQRTTDWFKRSGALTIVVGRFVAAVRVLAWPLARAHGVRYVTFLLLDVTAALAWTAIWVGLGWLLGARWADAPAEIRWISVALAVAAGAVFLAVRLWQRRRVRAAA
jgi:membrane protein DedA with SNARE-associated domain